ncbi:MULTISPECIES: sensor histidine kinase [Blautia]|uniref:sensor histidine kinase n=1 Tax=Blautia TaxID=572511 RepID=UPI000BA32387|nr:MULTISPECIES: HAMP domain-containing sensor histidine kinase [Blautia]
MMKKHTLQLQITGIVGVILVLACLLLTVNSLVSARSYYGDYASLVEEGAVYYDPALPEGELPPALDPDVTYQEASMKFSVQSVVTMAVIILLALAGTYWATGKMLRPLKELTESVQRVDDRNLDKRVELKRTQGEVGVLADAFNSMLERLEDAFLIQKSFAANAAHELKTPLAVIKSSLQVLEMTPNPKIADYKEFMQDTDTSLNRIIKTVEGLLALANLRDIPMDQRVELYTLLQQAVQELAKKARSSQVKLSMGQPVSGFVYGNPSLLYRAFYNLIENAIKYNRRDGDITVSMDMNGKCAVIQVADTGYGIGQEDLVHIFEPFYRADKSRSQRIPGSGLGLAVVKMILDKHGGKIEVVSELNQGSTFKIYLPV